MSYFCSVHYRQEFRCSQESVVCCHYKPINFCSLVTINGCDHSERVEKYKIALEQIINTETDTTVGHDYIEHLREIARNALI